MTATQPAVLLGYGGRPRPQIPRTLTIDPGPTTGILLADGFQPIDGAVVCLAAVDGWRADWPREETWRLAERYAERLKRAADAIMARHPGPARLALEGANPPAPRMTRTTADGRKVTVTLNKDMIEALYVVQLGIGIVLGRYRQVGKGMPGFVVVAPGRNRGEWHKTQYGGTGNPADSYPADLRNSWTERFLSTDAHIVKDRTGTDPTKAMHHLRECYDIAADAELRVRTEGGRRG
jgi:hypothetical protein